MPPGIHPASDSAHPLELPSGNQYLNHLGTVHAGAQLALAEASSGEFLLKHFASSDDLFPVVRRLEAAIVHARANDFDGRIGWLKPVTRGHSV